MSIYVIELFDDHEVIKSISDKAFTSYRSATEYLLDNDYEVYSEEDDCTDEWEVFFEKEIWHESEWYIKNKITASIIKLELVL